MQDYFLFVQKVLFELDARRMNPKLTSFLNDRLSVVQNDIVGQKDISRLQPKPCYLRLFYLFTYVPEVTYC